MVSTIILYAVPTIAVLYGIRKYRESKWGKCKNTVRLDGKVVVITGSNSGIGYETAKELASRGAEIIFACRNKKLALDAMKKIEKELQLKGKQDFIPLDLASIDSIEEFAIELKAKYDKIDILINNAGISHPKSEKMLTNDGFEMHFGVNYLGHFLLTNLLMDLLKKSENARVINIASLLHERGDINLGDLNYDKRVPKNAYANSKLAQMYFGVELANRTKDTNINVYSLCPGWVYTNLFRHSFKKAMMLIVFILPVAFLFMRNKKQGSQTTIYCATEPKLDNESGYFYRDCNRYTSKVKFDALVAQQLWYISDKMLKEKKVVG